MQGLMYAGAEKNIIDVLQVQKLMNKNGGKKFVPLSKHAKIAFENKTRVYYWASLIRYPDRNKTRT